jgi:uncharacterized protein YehS (DUF1456 family)
VCENHFASLTAWKNTRERAEEILSILSLADLNISKHELSAFFRRPDHKHYRVCKDQILRNFLTGLQIKYRGASHARNDEGVS